MADNTILISAVVLAAKNKAHFPNESPEYRRARNELLSEEIELRRHIDGVAARRRALPPGGEIPEDYAFGSSSGTIRLSQLFGDKDTLVIYSIMFGPERERACPMCTSMLTSWDGNARHLRERVALAVTERSPIERLLDFKRERGWQNLHMYSDIKGDYTRAYASADDGDVPGLTVFTRLDGTVRHFWSPEVSSERPTRASTRAGPRISIPCGRSLTSHPPVAAPPGTRSLNTPA